MNINSLRVGIDAKRAFCNSTGLGNYSRNIIRCLVNNYSNHSFFLFTPEVKLVSFYDEIKTYSNVTVITPHQIIYRWFPWYWRSIVVGRLAVKLELDIYHGLSHELPLGLHKKVRSVVTIHDMIIFKDVSFQNLFNIVSYRSKIKRAIRRADQIIAISNQTKNDIIQFFSSAASKVEVVYQPIDERFYQRLTESEKNLVLNKYNLKKPYIIQVGSIQLRKNIQQVLMAMSLLKHYKFFYVVVGKPTRYKRSLEEYIRNFGLSERVMFLTNVSDEELRALYQASTAVIYPSLMEGFGLPVVEGLASEVPVIATQGGCFEEAGGEAPIYIDSTNEHAIAKAILQVLQAENDLKQRVAKSKEHLQKFSPSSIAKALMKVYSFN